MNASSPLKLKYVANTITRGDAPSYVDEAGIPVVNQACVWPSGLALEKRKYHDPSNAKRVTAWIHAGDVLINSTGTGTLGRVAFVQDEPEEPTFADGHVTIIRGDENRLSPKYLFYVLSIQQEQITVECSEGATNQIELSRYLLSNKKINWPELTIQQQIVSFLDKNTQRLDTLIAAKENLLNLLTEKRRALITTAVTRGIDPTVRLKESGIPWLGSVPEHWEIERAKWLFEERDIRSEFGEEEMLTVSHLTGVTPRAEKNVNMFLAESQEGSKICEAGDLVINTLWAWMGAMGVSPQRGIVSPAYNVYEPGDRLDKTYLDYLLRMPVFAQEAIRYSKGVWSSRLRLYPEGLYEIWFPVPPVEEQKTIAEYLKTETAKLDSLKKATERTIALLLERRSALIAAAVTGEIAIGVNYAN